MNDNLEFLPEPETLPEQFLSESISPPELEETVMVELPVDILAALTQHAHQSGQTQTQAMLDVLRSALGLQQDTSSDHQVSSFPSDLAAADPSAVDLAAVDLSVDRSDLIRSDLIKSEALQPKPVQPGSSTTYASNPTADRLTPPLLAEIERLKLRLGRLEALIPKVDSLMGKLIAF